MSETIKKAVQSKYASVAKSGLSTGHRGVKAAAEAFGYTPEQLASIPAEANMGLSCGNPTAFASLKPRRSRMRWWPGRVPGRQEGRADRQGHRHRHDP